MSIINWQRREKPGQYAEWEKRQRLQLPDLEDVLDEPLGTPVARPRTARVVSDEIEHLRNELAGARELVKQGEAKEAALVAELTKAVDDELAAKKAAHDADVAELESLRPATGETA